MKVLVLTHASGIKFEYENFSNETVISEVYRSFQESLSDERLGMSLPSFRKLLKEFGVVKGWTASITNPATTKAQDAMRKASQRDEKRMQAKRNKKAERMAKRSLKNGSRAFMRSQKSKGTEVEEAKPFRPKINPLFAAMLGSGLSGRGR